MSWIPFYLTQYDKYWSREKNLDSPLTMLPSEYFLRQFYATFFNDPPSRWVFGTWGSDNLMWSNDYPHPNSTWPESWNVITRDLGHVSEAVRSRLLRDNARELYKLPGAGSDCRLMSTTLGQRASRHEAWRLDGNSRQQMEGEMETRTPSIIDLNEELAKLTMFRGRTPQSTMADRKGSGARLASYRDGVLFATKFAGKGHWERHPTGDELIHVLDGTGTVEIVREDGPQFFALRAGMMAVVPQGAWHRFHSSEGVTLMFATPNPSEHIELDVDDPRTVDRQPA